MTKYRVKYYDKQLSRKGRGTQVREFTDKAEAEEFASKNRIYARPCTVETIRPEKFSGTLCMGPSVLPSFKGGIKCPEPPEFLEAKLGVLEPRCPKCFVKHQEAVRKVNK